MRAPVRPSWGLALVLLGLAPQLPCWRSRKEGCLRAADLLTCAGLGLERIPAEAPDDAATLDLSHNRLPALRTGAFWGPPRLRVLRLAHNRLTVVEPGAFQNSSGELLRHLDLSSNKLRAVEAAAFQDLPGLEELLLFDNLLAEVEGEGLARLSALRRLYLGHNRLTDFPFRSIQGHSELVLLDLSWNRLPRLPLEDLSGLSVGLQQGLYLHGNPLVCDCAAYRMFRLWELRGYAAVSDFRRDYTCLMYGISGAAARFLPDFPQPCDAPVRLEVDAGRPALLHCTTALSGEHVTFFWVSPKLEYVAPPGNGGSLKAFANGSLEISLAQAEDSGLYLCVALDATGRRNETREVEVTVRVPHTGAEHESFNTGYTTLLGCVVSLVLVLMYLYLTPCRRTPRSEGASARVESEGAVSSTNKHVVFLEPAEERRNGRLGSRKKLPDEPPRQL